MKILPPSVVKYCLFINPLLAMSNLAPQKREGEGRASFFVRCISALVLGFRQIRKKNSDALMNRLAVIQVKAHENSNGLLRLSDDDLASGLTPTLVSRG